MTGDQPKWGAKTAFASFVGAWGASVLVVTLLRTVLSDIIADLPFPSGLLSIPLLETTMLTVTFLFVRYKGVNLKELGFKRASLKTFGLAAIAAVPLSFAQLAAALILVAAFGSSPNIEALYEMVTARDLLQLIAFILIVFAFVAPVEELVFRGFIQKGGENSFGKLNGLLMASVLFGLSHLIWDPQSAVTGFVLGLVLGYVWQKTDGNTTATTVTHGIYNAAFWILLYLGTI